MAVNDLDVYPNPNQGLMYLTFSAQKAQKYTVKLIEITGRQVMATTVLAKSGKNEFTFDATSIAPGVYQLVFADEHHQLLYKKVVIK